jgi:hypothetical protein
MSKGEPAGHNSQASPRAIAAENCSSDGSGSGSGSRRMRSRSGRTQCPPGPGWASCPAGCRRLRVLQHLHLWPPGPGREVSGGRARVGRFGGRTGWGWCGIGVTARTAGGGLDGGRSVAWSGGRGAWLSQPVPSHFFPSLSLPPLPLVAPILSISDQCSARLTLPLTISSLSKLCHSQLTPIPCELADAVSKRTLVRLSSVLS